MFSMFSRNETAEEASGPWVYSAFAPDTPAAAFGTLAPMVELWRSKRPSEDAFPAWADFDLPDFEGWWGQISLAEMRSDPLDLRWVLWGTKLTWWWGADYTGQRISEQLHLAEVWQHFERPYFESLLDNRLMGFVSGSLEPQEREFLHIHGVDLPLDGDGGMTHVMSAYTLRHAGDAFEPEAKALFRF